MPFRFTIIVKRQREISISIHVIHSDVRQREINIIIHVIHTLTCANVKLILVYT